MVQYINRKNEIYGYYNKHRNIDVDTIEEVNDDVVDKIKIENFEDSTEELYNIVAMCTYMIENDLYDEYFFNTCKELLDETIINEAGELKKDIDNLCEYFKKENIKSDYYDKLSIVYDKTSEN